MERLLGRLLLLLVSREDEEEALVVASEELLASEVRSLGDAGRGSLDNKMVDWWVAVAQLAEEHVSSHEEIHIAESR